jgi:hypothetical protein
MATICGKLGEASNLRHCPVCAGPTSSVATQTVKALLAVSLREVRAEQYRFCASPTCEVVYVSDDLAQRFTTDQLREVVYHKAFDDDEQLICYCFRYTVGAVRRGDSTARAAIMADITAGVQAGQCACDLRNPQGSCCLGTIRRVLKTASHGAPL